MGVAGANFFESRHAALVWQNNVQHNDVGMRLCDNSEGFGGRTRRKNLNLRIFETALKNADDTAIIIDNQKRWHR
jgi:hypothetical protein